MKPFIPTSDQLTGALEHIAYEVEQVVGSCNLFIHVHGLPLEDQTSAQSILLTNIALESFLIHTRALVDFFENAKRATRNNSELPDMLSSDFGYPASKLNLDPGLRTRINGEVAHLSYNRVGLSPLQKAWFPEAVARPLLTRCDDFIRHLLESPSWGSMPETLAFLPAVRVHLARLLGQSPASPPEA